MSPAWFETRIQKRIESVNLEGKAGKGACAGGVSHVHGEIICAGVASAGRAGERSVRSDAEPSWAAGLAVCQCAARIWIGGCARQTICVSLIHRGVGER